MNRDEMLFNLLSNPDQIDLEIPKVTYYSSTAKTLFLLMPFMNNANFIEIHAIKRGIIAPSFNLKGDELEFYKRFSHKVTIQQYSGMPKVVARFMEFLELYVNCREEWKEMLYKQPMSTKLRKD